MDGRWKVLGEFLRSRRARAEPDFLVPGDQRRVSGLRREELARAAGVSAAYLTRLEQGRAPHVSDDVLGALSRALSLDDAEIAYVWRLARPTPRRDRPVPEAIRPALLTLLEQVHPTPALILGRNRHVLAWNAMAHALHAPHLDRAGQPWWPGLLFGDARVAALFDDWDDKARDTVADLRAEVGRRPADDELNALVDELRGQDATFERLWDEQLVHLCAFHERAYHHEVVGTLRLHDEFLELADDDGQRLALFTPCPDSTAALAQLAEHVSRTACEQLPVDAVA